MPARRARMFLACVLLLAASARSQAQTLLTTTRIVSGLTHPLCITHPPGDYTRLFILEQPGRIRIYDLQTNTLLPTPFLDVSSLIGSGVGYLEYGLLGMCFDPRYATNGVFYITYTTGTTTLSDPILARGQVTANPNVADLASVTTILRIVYTRKEHRSGWCEFGPDGYLYLTTGDGGENDPDNAGSNLTTLRGKILRLDVDGPDDIPGNADDDGFPADANRNYCIPPTNPFFGSASNMQEIWAYGVRNAWRCAFDRATGDLWIGDVGQGQREELDFQPAASVGGENYGWRCLEGTRQTAYTGCVYPISGAIPPIYEYTHSVGQSVTGGNVYRGCAIPDLVGTYIFGDYQASKLFSLRYTVAGGVTNFTDRTAELAPGGGLNLQFPAAFGEDAYGEIYVCDWSGGEVFKIIPRTAAAPDCNNNGKPDPCEILDGSALDYNHNGIPDSCEPCPADCTGDHLVRINDIFCFIATWFGGSINADLNHNNVLDVGDIFFFLTLWFSSPPCP